MERAILLRKSKNLIRYRSENNFARLSKQYRIKLVARISKHFAALFIILKIATKLF